MAATIKDIARHLKISTSTVSYALNGGPRTVPEEVREKVLALARELDYRPNRVARSLVTRRANALGVVPPAVGDNVFLSPFVRSAWNGLVNAAGHLGQDLLLYTGHDRTAPNEPGQELLDGRIDGIIFIAPRPEASAVRFLHQRDFPFATLASSSEIPGPRFIADNAAGVDLALKHLFDLGHRRVAHFAGPMDAADGKLRFETFRSTSHSIGMDTDPELIQPGAFTVESGYISGKRLLSMKRRPTAVFCANDEVAYGLCVALREHGVIVPDEISVVGFDDTDLSFVYSPALTTIRQPIQAMAMASLRAVISLVNGAEVALGQVFPTELVVRESTAPVRQR